MTPLVSFALDTVAMTAAVGFVQAAYLLMRYENRPSWLQRETGHTLLSTVIALVGIIAIGFEVAGLMQLGLDGEMAILTAPMVCWLASWAIWRGFHCRERLAMADGGLSPFGRRMMNLSGQSGDETHGRRE